MSCPQLRLLDRRWVVRRDQGLAPFRQDFESKPSHERRRLSWNLVPQRQMSAVVDGAGAEEKRWTKIWADVSESEIDCSASLERAATVWAGRSDCTCKDDCLGDNRWCQHQPLEC